jgi:hypothetical protein
MNTIEPTLAQKKAVIVNFGKHKLSSTPNTPFHAVEVNHIWFNGGIPIEFKKETLRKMKQESCVNESVVKSIKILKEKGTLLEYLTKIGPDKRKALVEAIEDGRKILYKREVTPKPVKQGKYPGNVVNSVDVNMARKNLKKYGFGHELAKDWIEVIKNNAKKL